MSIIPNNPKNLVEVIDNEIRVSHRVIATNTNNQDKNISEMISKYKSDIEEFGRLPFKTEAIKNSKNKVNHQITHYLNEQQSTFLMTLLRNNKAVVVFKKALVKAFFDMRDNNFPTDTDKIIHHFGKLPFGQVATIVRKMGIIELVERVKQLKELDNPTNDLIVQPGPKKLNPIQATLHNIFIYNDIEKITNIIKISITGKEHQRAIKKESFVACVDAGNEIIELRQIDKFNHINSVMMNIFIKEFECGIISSVSLKWFSEIKSIKHIINNDKKFGIFWNAILNKPITIMCKNDIEERRYKFRKINNNDFISKLHLDNKDYFLDGKTAIEIDAIDKNLFSE